MRFPWFSWRLTAVCLAALACMTAAGCNSGRESKHREQSELKKLVMVYGRFLAQHRGQPPANEAEFKKFVESLRPADLASFGIDEVSRLFVSNRDGKPYVVIYGQAKGPSGPGGSPVIAYEQEGKGGRRWVATVVGAVEEVDEARFGQLVPTAKP
jgi:hypothetical protein